MGFEVIYKQAFLNCAKIIDWEDDSICIQFRSGTIVWYKEGKPHRLTGPAIIYPRKSIKRWFINGKEVSKRCVNK